MNRIETERLILRNFEERDLNDLYEYLSDPEVVKYEPYKASKREFKLEKNDRGDDCCRR